jgi:hypothetical protein
MSQLRLRQVAGLPRPLLAAALAGSGLALMAGVLASAGYGAPALGAMVAVGFLVLAITTYNRDPVLALIGLWVCEVFVLPVSSVFGYFSATGQTIRQADEAMVFLLAFFTLRQFLITSQAAPPLRFAIPAVGVVVCGIASSIVAAVPFQIAFVGAVLGLKLWIMIALVLLLPWKPADLDRVYRVFTSVGVFIALVGVADYFLHGAISHSLHGGGGGGGYRSDAVQSIFPTPGEYSLFMSLLFGVSFSRFARSYRPEDLFLALLFAASVLLSLRLKGFLSLAAVAFLVVVVASGASPKRAAAALLVGSLLVFGGYQVEQSVIEQQVTTYTSTESSARSRLYTTSEKIGADHFPLGVGFGRYASYMSHKHYSPVYYEYGLARVWGLSPRFSNFIEDTSWPSVIGETGYGGGAFYIVGVIGLLVACCRRLFRWRGPHAWLPLAALSSLVVLLLDSLGDPALFSWLAAATVAMFFCPLVVLDRDARGAPDADAA